MAVRINSTLPCCPGWSCNSPRVDICEHNVLFLESMHVDESVPFFMSSQLITIIFFFLQYISNIKVMCILVPDCLTQLILLKNFFYIITSCYVI